MMDSSMIGKIEKAHRYAAECNRFESLLCSVIIKVDNGEYLVPYDYGQWSCNSEYFAKHGFDSTAHLSSSLIFCHCSGQPVFQHETLIWA